MTSRSSFLLQRQMSIPARASSESDDTSDCMLSHSASNRARSPFRRSLSSWSLARDWLSFSDSSRKNSRSVVRQHAAAIQLHQVAADVVQRESTGSGLDRVEARLQLDFEQ